jgi:hypothetical protein
LPKYYPTDPDPAKAASGLAGLKSGKHGWKLHLNFDAGDPTVVTQVSLFLKEMKGRNLCNFKIGKGGGKAAGAPGKEATVYVGSKDDAFVVAKMIEDGLRDVLLPPTGDALVSDIEFNELVMGRFDVMKWDPDPLGYFRAQIFGGRAGREALFVQRYGTFYTGTQEAKPLSG